MHTLVAADSRLETILQNPYARPKSMNETQLDDQHAVLAMYHDLCHIVDKLFSRKLLGDTFWKFCVWPMMIAGYQAVIYQDETVKDSLCWELHNMSRSLGAGAMQDGAYLISHMFERQRGILLDHSVCHKARTALTWDDFFVDSPLFMM
jgi:hypothetical protein